MMAGNEAVSDVIKEIRTGTPEGTSPTGAVPLPVPPTKKRGRPPGKTVQAVVDPEQAQTLAICAAAFGKLASLPYDLLARKHPEIWTLREDEREQLGQATVRLLDRYMPAWLEEHPEVAAFVLVNVVIIVPRIPAYLVALQNDRKAAAIKAGLKPEEKENAHGDSRQAGNGKDNSSAVLAKG